VPSSKGILLKMDYSELKKLSVEDLEFMQAVLQHAEDSAALKSPKLQNIIKILTSTRK